MFATVGIQLQQELLVILAIETHWKYIFLWSK